jgi:hypothetical protein
MAFGLIRARNLSAADIASTDEKRNNSLIKTKYFFENHEDFLGKEETTLAETIDERLRINEVTGIRKNSNLAIEYLIGINDDVAWKNYSFGGFVYGVSQWLENRHGLNSVVTIYTRNGTETPRAYILVVPIEQKSIAWKNTRGKGERVLKRLNTRNFTGGSGKLRQLQSDYFKYLVDRFNGGRRLGIELTAPPRLSEEELSVFL